MRSIQEDMSELRMQLRTGAIQKAYRALLGYMLDLRKRFKIRYPNASVSGLYQGYMDMTYFAIVPPSFKQHDLKLAIVFNYDAFRFEAWLAGANRQVQRRYWELLRESRWSDYRVVAPAKGVDSIIECDLADDFDFGKLEGLTAKLMRIPSSSSPTLRNFSYDHSSHLSQPGPSPAPGEDARPTPGDLLIPGNIAAGGHLAAPSA
jgi:hypothetical protein